MGSDGNKTKRFLAHLEPLRGVLEGYCRRHLNDPNGTEDVLQEMLTKTFRDFDVYQEGTNFRAWAFRYLNLEILAWNRRHHRVPNSSAMEPTADPSPDSIDVPPGTLHEIPDDVLDQCDETLASAIRELLEAERSCLLLRAIGDFKYREIAEILGLPVGTVMSHLSRARAKLRVRLNPVGNRSLCRLLNSSELDNPNSND